ncbi:MAG TPA: hypothetical protein DCE13_03100 [Cryomorphaceae bacterium]|nr:MAG: hypothetical protein ABR98_00255 [Cryomorphaceae bacterium BACL7 MAG-120910-bin2]KRO68198.1 MAG: hypothetical protein ABR88_02735 [Cryomorphaceae bacterium BACL7 MAG-120322-bin74]KRO82243.1 MAG: hypothetical protein ABR87_02785 [Cryomorphaceae bacterium BACL7 MAG-121220-bin83]HAB31510.1 hypothetical protein [Cryomorphaceae bacterium]
MIDLRTVLLAFDVLAIQGNAFSTRRLLTHSLQSEIASKHYLWMVQITRRLPSPFADQLYLSSNTFQSWMQNLLRAPGRTLQPSFTSFRMLPQRISATQPHKQAIATLF